MEQNVFMQEKNLSKKNQEIVLSEIEHPKTPAWVRGRGWESRFARPVCTSFKAVKNIGGCKMPPAVALRWFHQYWTHCR
jgi:hypothetical protein